MGILELLGGIGDVLDTPGRFVRTGLSGRNPFASIFDPEQGASGRDMLESWGVLDPNREGLDAGDALGFGAELLTDPTNLLLGGLLGKTARAASLAKKARLPDANFAFTLRPESYIRPSERGFSGVLTSTLSNTPASNMNEVGEIGHVVGRSTPSGLRIENSGVASDFRGKGYGVRMYEDLAQRAREMGLPLQSDSSVSIDAANVYDALARRGYKVSRNPSTVIDDGTLVARGPVFSVSDIPEVPHYLQQPIPSINGLLAALGGYNAAMLPERGT